MTVQRELCQVCSQPSKLVTGRLHTITYLPKDETSLLESIAKLQAGYQRVVYAIAICGDLDCLKRAQRGQVPGKTFVVWQKI